MAEDTPVKAVQVKLVLLGTLTIVGQFCFVSVLTLSLPSEIAYFHTMSLA
jgi:hypothetical protein